MFPQALDSTMDNPFNVAHDILEWATPAMLFRATPGQGVVDPTIPYEKYTPPTPFTPVDGTIQRATPAISVAAADASYIDGGTLPVTGGNMATPPTNLGAIIGEQIGGIDEHGCSPSLPNGPVWCGTLTRCIPRSNTCPTDIIKIPAYVGWARDEHGCNPSTGYSWCDSLAKCVRKWETPCPTGVLADPCGVTPGYSWCEPLGRCANSCPNIALPPHPDGGGTDERGCVPSAGYEWCATKNKCIRPYPNFSDGETCPTDVLTILPIGPHLRETPPVFFDWLRGLLGPKYSSIMDQQALGDATITSDPGGVSVSVPVYRPIPRNMQVQPHGAMASIPRYIPGGISDSVPFVNKTNNMYIGVV